MSSKIQEIQKKLEKLEKEAKDLKQLKSDYDCAREFRRMLVKHKVD
jgi:archaellum component FlaC